MHQVGELLFAGAYGGRHETVAIPIPPQSPPLGTGVSTAPLGHARPIDLHTQLAPDPVRPQRPTKTPGDADELVHHRPCDNVEEAPRRPAERCADDEEGSISNTHKHPVVRYKRQGH